MKIGKHGLEKVDERSMKKNMDVDFYKKHDFGNEMREAVNSGRGIVGENMTPDQFFAMARAKSEARKAKNASKAVTIRIPVRVIEEYKNRAASKGVGYRRL